MLVKSLQPTYQESQKNQFYFLEYGAPLENLLTFSDVKLVRLEQRPGYIPCTSGHERPLTPQVSSCPGSCRQASRGLMGFKPGGQRLTQKEATRPPCISHGPICLSLFPTEARFLHSRSPEAASFSTRNLQQQHLELCKCRSTESEPGRGRDGPANKRPSDSELQNHETHTWTSQTHTENVSHSST